MNNRKLISYWEVMPEFAPTILYFLFPLAASLFEPNSSVLIFYYHWYILFFYHGKFLIICTYTLSPTGSSLSLKVFSLSWLSIIENILSKSHSVDSFDSNENYACTSTLVNQRLIPKRKPSNMWELIASSGWPPSPILLLGALHPLILQVSDPHPLKLTHKPPLPKYLSKNRNNDRTCEKLFAYPGGGKQ